jgi:hypothetical protein
MALGGRLSGKIHMPKDIEAKQKARQERNEAQAIEERHIWEDINAQADKAVAISRPRISYSEALANEMLNRMASGQSLNSVCKLDHMPHIATVFDWIEKHPSFGEKYARARELAAHALFDQMIDIADDTSGDLLDDGSANNAAIQRARLRVDTRARIAGKLAPKVYGERVEQLAQTVNVTNNSLTIDGRSLGTEQRQNLRTMLLAAREQTVNET